MIKRWFLVGMTFLLILLFFGGCGVAQDQYDAIVAELGEVKQEMQSVKAAHDKLITGNKNLEIEKTSLMTEKESLDDGYSKLSAQCVDLEIEKTSLMTEKESLEIEKATLTRELEKIKKSYESVYQELGALQVVCPPRYFSTSQELRSWIQSNAISDTPIHSNSLMTYKAYERSLEIQEEALEDGFIISVAVEGGPEREGIPSYYGDTRTVYCQAETGDGIYWWFPDRDEIELIKFYPQIEVDFAGNPIHGTAPLTVNFTDLSQGKITSWYWEFGDHEISYARHPTHTYTHAGIYTVSLRVNGQYSKYSKTIYDYIRVD